MFAREGPAAATFAGAARRPKAAKPAAFGPRRALRRDEGGQMMLLAGFIFVIALLAMSAMLARVPILAKQVSREADRPLLEHVSPMLDGLEAAIADLDPEGGLTEGTAKFDDAVRGLLAHMRLNAGSQGFVLEWDVVCGSPGKARVVLELSDGELWAKVRTVEFGFSTC